MMEHTSFTADFFMGNRQRLRELFTGTAPIVLTANGLLQQAGDTAFPFRQDGSFWYLTGIDEPDILYVYDKDKEYLVVPERSAARQAFDGATDETMLKRISGVETIYDEKEGWRRLGDRLQKVKHVATLAAPPEYVAAYGMYTNPARRRLISKIKSYNDSIELLDLAQHLALQRMVKQPVELAAIETAVAITIRSMRQALAPAKRATYAHEYEVEAELSRLFRRQGSQGHAFSPTFASGVRACTLHNIANSGALSADELLLCDVGASYDHYAADITRTVSLGTPSRRQIAVYDAVADVHRYAVSLLKPGMVLKDYEQLVEQFMGEKLRELGLIKTIDKELVRTYYPHSTSHFLGINVHDVGLYDRPLEPGVVLTVEPGIYIPEESIGIRLEDDIVITPEGNRVLSAALPSMFP